MAKPFPCPPPSSPAAPALPMAAMAALLLGGFVTAFDLFVVNVALPSMEADLAAAFGEIGLVVAAYALAFGTVLIAGGRLGDIHGRRRIYVRGMVAFTLASLLCGLAPDARSLIAARICQGAAGAVLFPQVYAVFRVSLDDGGRRRAFGRLGAILGFAAIAGQMAGGWIVEVDPFGLGWRLIFLVNLPIGAVAVALCRFVPESRDKAAWRVDWAGALLGGGGLMAALVPLLAGPDAGWPAWTAWSGAGAASLLAAFVWWERTLAAAGGQPTIDFAVFAAPGFARSLLVVVLVYSTPTAFFLCFALTLQRGFGFPPLAAAGSMVPMSLGFMLASVAAPRLSARFGTRALAFGMGLYALGFLWLIVIAPDFPLLRESPWLLAGMAGFGFGQGLSGPPLLNMAIGRVAKEYAGMAAGIVSTAQQLGGAFGLSIAAMLFSRALSAGPAAGPARYAGAFSQAMLYDLAVTVAAALLVAFKADSMRGRRA